MRGESVVPNKLNPRKIPKTQADVDRARSDGFNEGICGALTIMLYTLRDKFGADDEQLKEFSDAFNYTLDGINRGYVKEKDLKAVMKEEYGISVEIL
jgi:hypothetical protein